MTFQQEHELGRIYLIVQTLRRSADAPDNLSPDKADAPGSLSAGKVDAPDYMVEMVLRSRIPFLLPLSLTVRNGEKMLRADITACTSLASRCAEESIPGKQLRTVLCALREALEKLPGYLLNFEDLCLDPAYIYCGPNADEILFLYVPHTKQGTQEAVLSLSEFFLRRIDHSDAQAVDLAYALYDQVSGGPCHLPEVLKKLLRPAPVPIFSDESFSAALAASCQTPSETSPRSAVSSSFGASYAGHSSQYSKPPSTGHSSQYSKPPSTGHSFDHSGPTEYSSYSPEFPNQKAGRSPFSKRRDPARSEWIRTLVLPGGLILLGALLLILFFRMDRTQIVGMGFLWAALTWIVHGNLTQRQAGLQNLWAEEEETDEEEAFYRDLLRQAQESVPNAGPENAQSYAPNAQREYVQEHASNARQETAPDPHEPAREPAYRAPQNALPRLISDYPDRCPDIPLTASLVIGKDPRKASVTLSHGTISRAHARVEPRTGGYYVTDLFSTNGTFLNRQRIEPGQAVLLSDGDALMLADLSWKVSLPAAARVGGVEFHCSAG